MPLASKICSKCSESFVPDHRLQEICRSCIQKQREEFERELEEARLESLRRESSRILDELDAETKSELERAGLAPREIEAQLSLVPAEIKRRLPRLQIRELLDGKIPALGFGLAGAPTGCGKSCTIAALLKGFVAARLKARAAKLQAGEEFDPKEVVLGWRSWPETAERLKELVSLDRWESIADVVWSMERTPLLVLDDLGRERIRGSYTEDFSTGKLDSIVDARYRNALPILYTTNLTHKRLADVYGSAMISRLVGGNPLFELPATLRDLRLQEQNS